MKFLDDYMQEYYNNLPRYRTYEDAYNATEEKYFGKFGIRRYKNYDVFRAALSRWLAKWSEPYSTPATGTGSKESAMKESFLPATCSTA